MSVRYPPALLGGLLLVACPDPPAGETASGSGGSADSTDSAGSVGSAGSESTDGLPPDDNGPSEEPWEVVVDGVPFPVADVHVLTVGRKEFAGNFANRGVVEVLYDHEEETITVEARKYRFGPAGELDTLSRLSLWAYVTTGDPTHHPDPADDCTVGAWRDNCAIYAYYDGKSQPIRIGMDLRVHLPFAWRGRLLVETEDNHAESTWPRRGDVVIDGLCGSGEVALEAGRAEVRLCRELVPAPTCPLDQIEACAGFPDGSASEAWSPACPCGNDQFGQLLVRALQPWAADITVDVPGDVWLSAALGNSAAVVPECEPSIVGCDGPACVLDDDDPLHIAAEFNYPSPAAPAGAGYHVSVTTGGCTVIPFVNPGEDWSPDQVPQEELRGRVQLCTGCL